MSLHNVDVESFLSQDWQRHPRLFRQSLPGFDCPVDGNDLAALACEEDVESRLIIQQNQHWDLQDGPFTDDDFAGLPERNWTLLVQAVDHWIPEVASLLAHFRFIPRWRIDDIMVSYATDGGGVGPHFDHYDVFLIQGQGRRRWQIGQACDDSTALRQDTPLHQLADFEATQEWILEPGDILYLPPKLAHWGTAVGDDCITLSVGFRAPSYAAIIGSWSDEISRTLPESLRFNDPGNSFAEEGLISQATIDEVRRLLLNHLTDTHTLAGWFGRLMTEPKYGELPPENWTPTELKQQLERGAILQLSLGMRSAMVEQEGQPLLCVDGHSYSLGAGRLALAKMINTSLPGSCLEVKLSQLSDAALSLLTDLLNTGSLHFYDESD